jgi:hypothetical protein
MTSGYNKPSTDKADTSWSSEGASLNAVEASSRSGDSDITADDVMDISSGYELDI